MDSEAKQLLELVLEIIGKHEDEIRISPSWIATEAITKLDPERVSVPLVYLGCHLELRQIARGVLRSFSKPKAGDDAQHELFPGLQSRYPLPHSKAEEPVYVKLEHLDDDALAFNVARLRTEGEAKLRHADALEAWGRLRRRAA